MFSVFSNVVHIHGLIPAYILFWKTSIPTCLRTRLRAFIALRRVKTYLRSTMGQQRVSNIALIQNWKGICQLCSQQWHGSYHWYLRPSKRQRGLFLLTRRVLSAFLTIYICKNIFTSNGDGDLWCCIFDCFVKIWATCKNILRRWFTGPCTPQPLSKKITVRLCWKEIQDAFLVLGVQISFRSQFEISVKDRLKPKGHYLALKIGSWP